MRKIKILGIFLLVMTYSMTLKAQGDTIPVNEETKGKGLPAFRHQGDLGLGTGLDYGGIFGIQLGYSPEKHFVLFGSAGYYMINIGWQIGVKGLLIGKTTKNMFRPYIKMMYGSNSGIVVEDMSEYDKTYLGFTAGLGLELRFGKEKHHGLDVDLNIPFRTQEFWDDYDEVKNDPRVEIKQEVIPVAFSLGYHYEF